MLFGSLARWWGKWWERIRKLLVPGRSLRNRKELGRRGEEIAEQFLSKAGYKILGRRTHLGEVEVDLLAMEGDVLVLVEVKTRTRKSQVLAFWQVNRGKRQRLRRALRTLARKVGAGFSSARCDVIVVVLPDSPHPEIFHFKNVPLGNY
jgi:putative endonuclease